MLAGLGHGEGRLAMEQVAASHGPAVAAEAVLRLPFAARNALGGTTGPVHNDVGLYVETGPAGPVLTPHGEDFGGPRSASSTG